MRRHRMNTQHIETLIIGAGQAGLATGYHLKRRGRAAADCRRRTRGSATTGGSSGTRCGLYTPAKYDRLPGLPFPAASWHCPQKDEVGDYLERYALHFDLPVRTSTRVERLEARPGGGYLATVRQRGDQLRERGGGHGHLRPHAERARIRSRPRRRPSSSCTPASTGGRPSSTRTGSGRRRLAFGAGHRLRACRVPPNDPVRPGSRQHPVPPGIPAGSRAHACSRVRVQARADPAHADGPQGDAGRALPRRTRLPDQTGRPGPPRGDPQPGPDDWGNRRAPAARPTAPSSM